MNRTGIIAHQLSYGGYYYPKVREQVHGDGYFLSTLVRKKVGEVWHAIPVSVSYYNIGEDKSILWEALLDTIAKVQLFYKPVDYIDTIDRCQLEEEERFLKENKYEIKGKIQEEVWFSW